MTKGDEREHRKTAKMEESVGVQESVTNTECVLPLVPRSNQQIARAG